MERLIKNLRLVNFLLVIGLTLFGVPLPVFALPEGGQVVSGQATIGVDGSNLTVTQSSSRAIVNWDSFSIGEAELVQILQPGSSSANLSRVVGGDPSEILGQLLSNGQVFLINPNGIIFGVNSKINVASLFASTLNISDQDFLSGKYRFLQDPGKALSFIVNRGEIRVADGGYVVIAAPLVNNEGVIIANLGQVKLAGTSELGLDISGTGLISVSVGKVVNPGTVELPTDLATALIKAVVNTDGLIPAGGVVESGGVTRLVGAEGTVINAGSVQAAGGEILVKGGQAAVNAGVLDTRTGAAEGNYGLVEVSGSNFQLGVGSVISAGTIIIDPLDVVIAEGTNLGAPNTFYEDDIESALDAGTNVTIAADNSITMNDFTTGGDEGINATGSGDFTLLIDDSELPAGDGVGTISFTDANDFIAIGTGNLLLDAQTNASSGVLSNIGTLSTTGGNITLMAGGSIGVVGTITTAGTGNIAISSGDASLTINNNLSATGTGSINLIAGDGNNNDGIVRTFTNNAAITTADGDITITADNMSLAAGSIGAGGAGNYVILKPYYTNTLIDLGGADAFNGAPAPDQATLGLTDAELDTVTSAILTIGAPTGGAVTVTAPISLAPASVPTLVVNSGSYISDDAAAPHNVIQVDNLALRAGGHIGAIGANVYYVYTDVDNLAAVTTGVPGRISITESDDVTVGTVTTDIGALSGLTNTDAQVELYTLNGSITVSQPILQNAPTLTDELILDANSTGAAADINIGANITSATGDIHLQADDGINWTAGTVSGNNVFLDAADYVGTPVAPVLVNAGDLGGQVTTAGGGFYVNEADNVAIDLVNDLIAPTGTFNGISTNNGDIQVTLTGAGNLLTIWPYAGGNVRSAGGDIKLVADDMLFMAGLGDGINSGSGDIYLNPYTSSRTIDIGTNTGGRLGLTQAELLEISGSGTVVLGEASETGGILLTAGVNLAGVGYNLALVAGDTGAGTLGISDGTSGSGGNVLALPATLTLIANRGIDFSTQVSTLAAFNLSDGIRIDEADALNVGAGFAGINGITSSSSIGIYTTSGTLTTINGTGGISTNGSVSTITLAAGGENDLVLNDFVRSNAGPINLFAGRDVLLNNAAAQVYSHDGVGGSAGAIRVGADFNTDGAGVFSMVPGSSLNSNSVGAFDSDIVIEGADFASAGASIDAGYARIYIAPSTGSTVGLGVEAAGFDLVQADFNSLNADGGIIIGYDGMLASAGNINVTAPIVAGADPLTLIAILSISSTPGSVLTVNNVLTLDAGTGIGGSGGPFLTSFEIDALSVAARTRVAGNVDIVDANGVGVTSSMNTFSAFNGIYTGAGSNGSIGLYAVTGNIDTFFPISADGAGNVNIGNALGNISILDQVSSTTGRIWISAANVYVYDNITTGGGTYGAGIPGITITGSLGSVQQFTGTISTTGAGGGVNITAGTDFIQTLPASITSADYLTISAGQDIVIDPAIASTFIDLRAWDDIIITGNLTATNSHIYLRANNDGILANDGEVGVLAGGNVIFDGSGGPITITASDLDANGDGVVLVLGENIYGLGTAAGDITFNVNGSLPAGDGGLPPFEFALALLAEENVGTVADPVLITANLGTGSFITIGDADLSLIDTVANTFSHDPNVVAGGHLGFAAGVLPDGTGEVNMDANSIINSMDIVIIAPGPIVLDQAAYSALGDIFVQATAGAITVNPSVVLTAGLDGNMATSGNITLLGQTGVTISAGTSLAPTSIVAEDAVTITAATGDILIGEYTTIHSGHVLVIDPQSPDTNITATAGSIYFTGTNGNIDIDSYGNVFLSALNNITPYTSGDLGAGNIRARFGNVSAIATTGDVDLDQFMVLSTIGDVIMHAGDAVATDGTITVNNGYFDVQAGTDGAGADGAFIQGPNSVLNLSGNLVVGPNVAGNNIAIFDSVGAGNDVVTFNGTVTTGISGHITMDLNTANIPGNIVIGGYLEAGDNVYISTDNGVSNGISGGGNILADQITLIAPVSGADDGLASIGIGNLEARQWIQLTAADNVTTGSLTARTNNAGYAIRIDANDDAGTVGSVTVNGLTTANANPGLNVLIDPVQVDINGNVSVSGSYQAWATGDINLNANINAVGNVDLYADSTGFVVADADVSSGDDFTQLAGTYIQAGVAINLAGDNLTLQTLTAGTSITATSNYDNTGAAGNISLGGNLVAPSISLWDNGGSLNLDLLNNVLIQTTNTALLLNTASLDGNYGLTLQTGSGPVALGTAGAVTPLNSLVVNTTGLTTFLNGSITAVNDLDFGSATGGYNLAGASVLTSNSGDIDLGGGDIFGANTLGLSAANGLVTLSTVGAGVNPTGLTVSGAAALLNGDIAVDGNVNFSGTVSTTLGGDRTIDASGGAASTITLGPVQGAHDLTLVQGADDSVVLDGISQLTRLDITSGPAAITFNGIVNMPGDIEGDAVDIISINAPVTSTGGFIDLIVLNTNANAGTINVNANLIGNDVVLQALDSTPGTSVLNIGATLNNTRGGYVLNAGDGTLNVLAGISALTFIDIYNSGGIANLGADLLSAGPVTLNDAVNLSGAVTVTSLASNVYFGGDVSGANTLTANAASGTVTFASTIGFVGAAPTGLTVTAQDAVFNNGGSVNGNINVTAGNDIDVTGFLASIAAAGTIALTAGDDLNIGIAGDGAVGSINGDITLTAHDLYLGDAGNVNAGQLFTVGSGNIKLDVSDNVVMNANTTGGSGSVGTIISSGGWIDIDPINVVINGAGLLAVSDIDVTADNTITVLANVRADIDTNNVGDVTLTAGGIINAGSTTTISGENVNITGGNNVTLGIVTADVAGDGAGDIDVVAVDALVVNNDLTAGSVSGVITLTSQTGPISIGGDVDAPNVMIDSQGSYIENTGGTIIAGNLGLIAQTGIGSSASPMDLQVSNLLASTASGDIYVEDTGSLTIGVGGQGVTNLGAGFTSLAADDGIVINADIFSNGDVELDADLDSDNIGAITRTAGLVTADDLTLVAAQGIGTSGAPILTSATTLAATNSTSGVIAVVETDDLALNLVNNPGRNIYLRTGGSLTDNNGAYTNNVAAGNFYLSTGGYADIDTDVGLLNDWGTYGNIGQSLTIREVSGITLGSNPILSTTDGDIDIRTASGTIVATNLVAGGTGDIRLVAGGSGSDIEIGLITASGDQVWLTAADAIFESPADGGIDITAGELALEAVNGIGSGNALETAVSRLSAYNSNSGDIRVDNNLASGLTIDTVAGIVGVTNLGGGVYINEASPLTVSSPVLAVGAVVLTANNTVVGDGTGDMFVNASVESTGSTVTLDADDSIYLGADVDAFTTATVRADGEGDGFGLIAWSGGVVTAPAVVLDAAQGIGAVGLAVQTSATTLTATSDNGDVVIVNDNLSASTATTLSTGTGNIDVTQTGGGSLTVTSATTGSGDIRLTAVGANLTANTVTAGGAGDVYLTTLTSGNIYVHNVTAAGDQITANSAGLIEELGADGPADLTAATLDLDAVSGIGTLAPIETAATTISADSVNGNIDLDNTLGTAVTATSLTTGTGNILFSQLGGGALTVQLARTDVGNIGIDVNNANLTVGMATAGALGGGFGDGNITLTTSSAGNISVDNVTALLDTITINSAGNIVENGDAGVDLRAGTLDLDAIIGIGSADAIETSAVNIDATTFANNLRLNNDTAGATVASNLTVTGAAGYVEFTQTGGGSLSVLNTTTNGGDITINVTGADLSVTTATAGGAGDVYLTTLTSGNVTVGNITAADDLIRVTSAGAIEELGADGGADLTAAELDLNAVTGIGVAGTIETAATTIAADSTDGDVVLANSNGALVTATSLTTGIGDIIFSQAGGGALTVNNAQTTAGDIDISVTGANLTVLVATAGTFGLVPDGDIRLTTTTSGNIYVGNVTAGNDLITVTSAGAIEESGSDGGADLTAFELDLNAVTGIGAAAALETSARQIAADSTNGNINIDNSNALAVTVSSLTTGTGSILFSQAGGGSLTVENAVTGNGAIGIDVTGADLTALVVTAGGAGQNVTLTTVTSGDVFVENVTAANDLILVNSAGAIDEYGAGDDGFDLTATTLDLNAVTGIGTSASAPIETTATAISADSSNGNISLANSNAAAVTVSSLTTGVGDIYFSQAGGGSLTVTNASTADGDITLEVTSANLTANTVTAGGSGVGDGNVTLTTLVSGNVYVNNVTAAGDLITVNSVGSLQESGADGGADLTAAELDLNAVTGIGTAGAVEVTAATIAADSSVSGSNQINSLATGPVLVTSLTTGTFGDGIETGFISFNQTGNQPLTVLAASTQEGDITIANAGADLTVYAATAGAAAGSAPSNLTLTVTGSGSDIYIDNLRAEYDQITITAPLGEIAEIGLGDPEVDLTTSTLILTAYSGIGATNPLETEVDFLWADNNYNDIQIDNTGDLFLRSVVNDNDDIWIYNEGDLIVQNTSVGVQTVVDAPLGNVEVYASGSINVYDNLNAGDDLLLAADATRALAFAVGPVPLALYEPENDLGGIYMDGGTSVTSSGSGVVELVASEDIELSLVAAGSGTGIIFSKNGAIVDSNGGDNNVLAEDLVMHANLGIGTLADRLETAVTNLAAENITSGEIALTNTASQDNFPVPGDGIPELILATLLDVNTPIGGLTLSVDGLNNQGGGVHLRELAGDILDNLPPMTEVIPFSMDVVANGNSTLEADNGIIGRWNDPLEVNVVGSLTAGALGDPSGNKLVSVNLAGIVMPSDQVELPYETPGLVLFNWHIMGDGVLLQALREAQSQLDIEVATDIDSSFFGPLILDVVTDVWLLPEVPEIEVVVEGPEGKVRKLASL